MARGISNKVRVSYRGRKLARDGTTGRHEGMSSLSTRQLLVTTTVRPRSTLRSPQSRRRRHSCSDRVPEKGRCDKFQDKDTSCTLQRERFRSQKSNGWKRELPETAMMRKIAVNFSIVSLLLSVLTRGRICGARTTYVFLLVYLRQPLTGY